MRHLIFAALLAATASVAIGTPAAAQSYEDQQRWEAAQARYQQELARYQAERDRYATARAAYRDGFQDGRDVPPPQAYDDRDDSDFDAASHYRDGPNYRERELAADDRVYRGSDGRYYCRRSDGTTGLIIGAATGGILGNVIDGGHSRAAGTLIGGALGALAGKSIDQNNSVRCR